jgi:chemotaxis protein methyltransferase CheR
MEIQEKEVRDFQNAIREHSSYDFSGYSVNSLKRRIEKIIEDYNTNLERLIRTISADPLALEEVVKRITVNTTELFRDPKLWSNILLKLLPRFNKHSSINIWHAGCSTGQEVYSMMIVLDQLNLLERTNIYASDLNTDVLEIAKKGRYRLRFNREYIDNFNEIFDSKNNYDPYNTYFIVDETKDRIQMRDFLCKKPIFKKIDLVKDYNLFYLNFDIIICRNVIIYFNIELQNKVLRLFHRNLKSNGCLVMGVHESIIGAEANLFIKEGYFYVKRKL